MQTDSVASLESLIGVNLESMEGFTGTKINQQLDCGCGKSAECATVQFVDGEITWTVCEHCRNV